MLQLQTYSWQAHLNLFFGANRNDIFRSLKIYHLHSKEREIA